MLTAFLLICSLPVDTLFVEDRVDVIEINHFHDDDAKLIFSQIVFYEWRSDLAAFVVRDWRLLKGQCPRRLPGGGGYVVTWADGEVWRKVRSRMLVENWTQYDPELLNRELLPKEKRRILRTR